VRTAKLRERTLDGGDPTFGHTCVARRRVQLGMPKQSLDCEPASLRQGHTEAAEELYQKAFNIAEEQRAKLWELRAAVILAPAPPRPGLPRRSRRPPLPDLRLVYRGLRRAGS
jgi:hypothetical protein